MKIDDVAKIAQSCYQGCPTIVLGSGATMPYGLPSMTALSVYLRDNLTTSGIPEDDAWTLVRTALGNGDHLEAALEGKIIPPSLLSKIVRLTWQCVNEKDLLLLETAAANGTDFVLGHLLYAMLNSTQNVAHIVTTNYDRVAEYACNSMGLLYQTGFAPGYVQKWVSDVSAYGSK